MHHGRVLLGTVVVPWWFVGQKARQQNREADFPDHRRSCYPPYQTKCLHTLHFPVCKFQNVHVFFMGFTGTPAGHHRGKWRRSSSSKSSKSISKTRNLNTLHRKKCSRSQLRTHVTDTNAEHDFLVVLAHHPPPSSPQPPILKT